MGRDCRQFLFSTDVFWSSCEDLYLSFKNLGSSGRSLQTVGLGAQLQLALQISVSRRPLSSSEQPTSIPTARAEQTSASLTEDNGAGDWKAGSVSGCRVDFFALFGWPGCELIWRPHWKDFEHYEGTLERLDERSSWVFSPARWEWWADEERILPTP